VLFAPGFGLNVTPEPDQVYVRAPPSGSVAATLTFVVVPVTGFGLAEAAAVIVGGWFGALVTVTLAVPLRPLEDAVTVKGPPTVEAVNNPDVLIVPPPDTVHVNAVLIAAPN
jgi:hypothetical protein